MNSNVSTAAMWRMGEVSVCLPKVNRISTLALMTGMWITPRVPVKKRMSGVIDRRVPRISAEIGIFLSVEISVLNFCGLRRLSSVKTITTAVPAAMMARRRPTQRIVHRKSPPKVEMVLLSKALEM